MTLTEAIMNAGMTPPKSVVLGKFMRFPGCGKARGNHAGWCRLITPTLAIYGDWSTGLSEIWHDSQHQDNAESRRLFAEARQRERQYAAQTERRRQQAALTAEQMIAAAQPSSHPYLERKGLHGMSGLVLDGKLVVPMRDAQHYERVMSAQLIEADGTKKFLPGGRASGAAFRIGTPLVHAKSVVLCEGYATGLSLYAALVKLPGPNSVVVCFSAQNLETVAQWYPTAVIAADNDKSAVGEQAAIRTGLRWTMPYEVGTDFNDLYQNLGVFAVMDRMRELLRPP